MTYCYGLASVVVRCALTSSSQELQDQSLPNLVCFICSVRRQENVNFMTSHHKLEGNVRAKSVKLMYFFKKIVFSTQGHGSNKLYVYRNADQGRVNKNCKFDDPRARGSCARVWPYKSYSENALFL